MKKKTIVAFLVLSLVLSLFILIRLYFVKNVRSWESYILASLIAITAIGMLYLAYKGLIQRFRKNYVDHAKYAVLFDLDRPFVTGELEFYFTLDEPKNVSFQILDANMQTLEILKDADFQDGGHIIRYNTTTLANGNYFYCLITDNQKTMKRMTVKHDNVTA